MKIQGQVYQNDLIHLFKHWFRTISSSKLVSVSGFRFSVAGFIGIAGFVLATRRDGNFGKFNWLGKSEEHPPERLLLVPGLQNLGNNCFLNVILQALASCSYFQSYLQKAIEECEGSGDEDLVDNVPLAVALASLLGELCVVGEGRVVLSPRRVMLSIAHYIPNFNLTAQQDAAEAFLHLLSSLREEFAGSNDLSHCSLLESCSSSCRMITPKQGDYLSKQERWQQNFVGPFNGILGSILTCQSCSSQISLNFEAFHSLLLSPVLDAGSSIMVRCSLGDCLKQFTVAERVENYHCTNCWHIAGIKFLTAMGGNETEMEKLRTCTEQDFCDCQKIFGQDTLPWSNKFSYTLKQISIARSPKILCIHLKRVSINFFGEQVKIQGHVSFPSILDLSTFMTSGVSINTREENFQGGQARSRYQKPSFHTEISNIEYDTTRNLNYIYGGPRGGFFSSNAQDLPLESNFNQIEGCTEALHADVEMQPDEQVSESSQVVPPSSCLYRLVSAVEHFGRAGGGHYTVYRSTRAHADSFKDEIGTPLEPDAECWFCISDSEVHRVSEKDVLAAEASLLFYEKILQE